MSTKDGQLSVKDWQDGVVRHGWQCEFCHNRFVDVSPGCWNLTMADDVKNYWRLGLMDTICSTCVDTLRTELDERIERYERANCPYGESFDGLDQWCSEQDGKYYARPDPISPFHILW